MPVQKETPLSLNAGGVLVLSRKKYAHEYPKYFGVRICHKRHHIFASNDTENEEGCDKSAAIWIQSVDRSEG